MQCQISKNNSYKNSHESHEDHMISLGVCFGLAGYQDDEQNVQRSVWSNERCESESVHLAKWTVHQRHFDQEHQLRRTGPETS